MKIIALLLATAQASRLHSKAASKVSSEYFNAGDFAGLGSFGSTFQSWADQGLIDQSHVDEYNSAVNDLDNYDFGTATTAGQCLDTDNGATDPWNDDCADYTANPSWCGGQYDDDDFKSGEMCCACGGGATSAGASSADCSANDYATDSFGDTCLDYADHPGWCGNYDSPTFQSLDLCCACQ